MSEYRVTDFTATPQMEGPQILLQWALPTDAGSTLFRVLRKEKSFSENETDGTLLLADTVGSGTVSYVDINPSVVIASFAATDQITIATSEGDLTDTFIPGNTFVAAGSAVGNAGTYTIESRLWDGTNTIITTVETTITAEPAPTSATATVTFINTVWCYSAFVYHTATTAWTANTLVDPNTVIIPTTPTGFFYVSDTRGFTGASEPLLWPTIIGSTIQDGDIIWTCVSVNPGWITSDISRRSAFTWNSDYMQRLLFQLVPPPYRDADLYSEQVRLSPQQDTDNDGVWRAIHEDGIIQRGEFERFLLIFSSYLAKIRGAADFYPKLVDPDETLVEYLPFLAGNVGWNLVTTTRTGAQRQAILSAVPIYKVKGTITSFAPQIRQALGVLNVVVDPMSKHILISTKADRQTAKGGIETTYPTWVAGTYARGDIVIPSSGKRTGYYYQARAGGTTGGPEPTWPTTPGLDVADFGGIIWRTVQFGVPHLTADIVAHAIDSFTATNVITLEAGEGDVSARYPAGLIFAVSGSTDGLNDGTYTVLSAPSATPTVITTVETTITTQTASPASSGPFLIIDDTSIFTIGATVNVRDSVTPEGEESVILDIPDSTTLSLDGPLINGYTLPNIAVVSPAFDWFDDETGFIWDIPGEESFEGIDPDRILINPAIVDPSELYSFAVLRIWALVASGESISTAELVQAEKIVEQFTPSDTKVVVRIEGQ